MTIWSWLRAVARPTAIVLGLGIGIAGCTALPGDGPWMGGAQGTSSEALPFDVIDLTPTTIAAYMQPPSIDKPSITSSLSAGGQVAVAPGDALKVRIFEPYEGSIFPTIQKPGADFGVQRVLDDGTINIPFVGTVQVAGLSLLQIERRIAKQLEGKAQDPQVIVEFVADRTHTVMISGDVKNPGRVSILEGVRSVVDAINRAGGPAGGGGGAGGGSGGPTQVEVVVRRKGQVILTAQYSELLAGGDIAIQKGDEIVLRPNSRVFTILGAVMKSGNVEMTKHNLPLIEALGQVGGLNDMRANKTGVYVFRMGDLQNNPAARARVFRLDLLQPVSMFVGQQFGLQPRDVVYVTNAPLYEYDKVLTSIYRTFSILSIVRSSGTSVSLPAF
ncbi:MAG: polysaccharide biosynthesis/export family protein [Reyranella sp.]|uniref:polysaccharide biosynthesis/export family protein n=1 Tax=Reyranella sp. TaxID=1929291 RepID=UPI0027302834|nr:polysaccharide biosynthesis/export family protein [Reyranella sp.]MDP1965933.1 polysaccharide biosynthesis/export family protein [Reyranella sp.]MDP2374935.1 polysaccharide biosynthesis/export family protein [Reyranella sp.]